MTAANLLTVTGALADILATDALVGVDGSATPHLAAVDPDAEWIVTPLPGAAIAIAETQRVVLDPKRERVTAMILIRLSMDGKDGRGDKAIYTLVESVRRCLILNQLLASGSPPVALLELSAPKGETYEVLQLGERGWMQTAVVRWQAQWVQSRTFADAVPIAERLIRTIRLSRNLQPESGGDETQPTN